MSCALPHADAEAPKEKKKRNGAAPEEKTKAEPGNNAGESPSKGEGHLSWRMSYCFMSEGIPCRLLASPLQFGLARAVYSEDISIF